MNDCMSTTVLQYLMGFQKSLSIFQTFATDTTQWHVSGIAEFVVSAFLTRKILPAHEATLREADAFVLKDFNQSFHKFFDIIGVCYPKSATIPVITQPETH
jgi:hypothetical protein